MATLFWNHLEEVLLRFYVRIDDGHEGAPNTRDYNFIYTLVQTHLIESRKEQNQQVKLTDSGNKNDNKQ